MLTANKLRIIIVALLIGLIGFKPTSAPAGSGWKRVIVKCAPEDLDEVKRVLGAAVLDYDHGQYLLSVNSNVDTNKVNSIRSRVGSAINGKDEEEVQLRNSTPTNASDSYTPPKTLGRIINYYGAPAPQIYTEQFAVNQIELKDALENATGDGIRVAIIDTGIDFKHPVFSGGILLPGRNYVGRTTIPSESDDPILTQSGFDLFALKQSGFDLFALTQSGFDLFALTQSGFDLYDVMSKAPAFGHGTMVTGLFHLVAPRAQIIPLKAFSANGSSNEWNIVRAIRDAVDMGADIINMSFAGSKNLPVVEDAIQYAASRGVILVAAVGNENNETPTYPSFYEPVVAVTSVSSKDTKSTFANYGKYVDISAPGEHLITTFPTGFASVSGTSDSAPLVSGVFAIAKDAGIRAAKLRRTVQNAVDRVNETNVYKNLLGSGRVNAAKAVKENSRQNDWN